MIRNPLKVGKFYLEAKNKHLPSLRGKHTMRNDLKVKFLKYLNSNKKEKGFTLIELLVVIIIIGLLTAIALPSFLNQSNKAKLSEAKNTVRSASEAQKAFYAEEGTFVSDGGEGTLGGLQTRGIIPDDVEDWLEALGVAVDGLETPNYRFEQTHNLTAATISLNGIPLNNGEPAGAAHKAYLGGITVVRGIVDQVYCEAVKAPVEDAELTGEDPLTLEQGEPATCGGDATKWRSSKANDNGGGGN